METVTLYLRTPLYSLRNDTAHVPGNVWIIDGKSDPDSKGALLVRTTHFRDEKGGLISESSVVLRIPWSKVDHIHVREGSVI